MTHEELHDFSENVAGPVHGLLFDKTDIPNGFCCIDNVDIHLFDGRSCGRESEFKASGLMFQDGRVEDYTFFEEDINFTEFIEAHKNCVFVSNGKLTLLNDLEEYEIKTLISRFDICAAICHEVKDYEQLNFEFNCSDAGMKFAKMRWIYQAQSNEI